MFNYCIQINYCTHKQKLLIQDAKVITNLADVALIKINISKLETMS